MVLFITVPSLRFKKSRSQGLKIQEDGLRITTVMLMDLGADIHFNFGAFTDGLLKDGKFYWEIDVPSGTTGDWECGIGVCNRDRLEENAPKDTSMYVTHGVGLKCKTNQYAWYPYCKVASVVTHKDNWKACERIERFGVYLDTFRKVMVFIDCCRNQIFGTMKNIDVSSPLVPAVSLVTRSNSVSVHLVSQSVLPKVLCDKLGESATIDPPE